MPSNTNKSAAVPFINQKGERSMKRVKVERYVAGKKPAYAKEDDDEEEYYTTEDEADEQDDYDEEEEEDEVRTIRTGRNLDYTKQDDDDDDDDDDESSTNNSESQPSGSKDNQNHVQPNQLTNDSDEDDDDDDPRFRKLKQIESKASSSQLADVHRTQLIQPKYELKNVVLDEDDDEEEIRQRHAAAKKRELEVPTGKSRIAPGSGDPSSSGINQGSNDDDDDDEDDDDSQDGSNKPAQRLETDDLLKDLKLTGISRPVREKLKTAEEEEAEARRLKEMLEQAKQEASFTKQTYEKINEDIKKEEEKEALAKGDIGAREMTSVNTDDEDDELAYEEWKLREIQRVLRDRSERMLATNVR